MIIEKTRTPEQNAENAREAQRTTYWRVDRDGNALVPGAVYAGFVHRALFANAPTDPPRLVGYVKWDGAELIDENGKSVNPGTDIDIDFLALKTS